MYLGLLVFRLIHYRREFHSLISARNTTESRFMRLFTMALVTSVVLLPYSFFVLYQLSTTIVEDYSWSKVHGDDWNSVVKVPAYGAARWDRWGEVATGYVMFLCFGTGADANNTYKRIFTSIGLGKLFPSLYNISESSGGQTPSSVTFGKRWTSSISTKAKSLLSSDRSITGPSHNDSYIASAIRPGSASASVTEPILPPRQYLKASQYRMKALFTQRRHRYTGEQYVLPLHSKASTDTNRLPALDKTNSNPTAFTAHAWAGNEASRENDHESPGVHVVHEVHQAHQDKEIE